MRLVIAEDSAILRDGLVALVTRRGHEVVAAVADGDELVARVARLAAEDALPDVAVVDIRMPPTFTDEGLRAALALRAAHPDLGVLLFSQYVETRFASELLTGERAASGTCSRTASRTSASSSTRSRASRPGRPCSTPRS